MFIQFFKAYIFSEKTHFVAEFQFGESCFSQYVYISPAKYLLYSFFEIKGNLSATWYNFRISFEIQINRRISQGFRRALKLQDFPTRYTDDYWICI